MVYLRITQPKTGLFGQNYKNLVLPCRRGNCKLTTLGQKCEIGLRRKTYNVLAGSVLSVWTKVEEVLTHDGNKRGQDSKMQVLYVYLITITSLIPIFHLHIIFIFNTLISLIICFLENVVQG